MDTADSVEALRRWLMAGGAVLDKLSVRPVGGGERALCTSRPVVAGERLAEIPDALTLTPAHVRSTAFGQGLMAAGLTDDHLLLLAFLRHEAPRADSMWRPYLDTLPVDFPTFPALHALWCAPLLHGTRAGQIMQQDAKATLLRYQALQGYPLGAEPGFSKALHLSLLLHTRTFGLRHGEALSPALVPYLDMANHAGERSARWGHDAARGLVYLDACRPHAADEEVVVSYGPLSN
ncbi:MAG TPA: SET domain-containing protein, partial [Myxococcota bacterium]|nr:SET domain-containing protein [Myxococcota bacterium]